MKRIHASLAVLLGAVAALGCRDQGRPDDGHGASEERPAAPRKVRDGPAEAIDLTRLVLESPTPYIPPQCYTRTKDDDGNVHNPCFICHAKPRKPNYVDDSDLQLSFAFPEPARENPWTNLFVDRRPFIEKTSDEKVLAYVRSGNYARGDENLLAKRLENLPKAWDENHDGHWNGYVPDAGFDFDPEGYDRNSSGKLTGWRAYAYHPFPGTFFPTNGSAGDALIRLPQVFRHDERGKFDRSVYTVNLAIVEALVKRRDVEIDPVDERVLGVDLDKNGALGVARRVRFDWAPRKKRYMSYVGQARLLQKQGEVDLAAGLFPVGTELLHSVRYLDVSEGRVTLAARMKELRYARKVNWRTYSNLEQLSDRETREKRAFPDRVRQVVFDFERGASNGQGWRYQGFIEDKTGELRPQSYEETAFCVGCHGGTSATTDGVFSFGRKVSSASRQRGWYHWTQHGVEGLPDLRRADGEHEYVHYLRQNGAGDELRANEEVSERFFAGGHLDDQAVNEIVDDVSGLILPSAPRALALDKAYWAVVLEQSFKKGRDAVLAPARNVHRTVDEGLPTGVKNLVAAGWMSSSLARR